MAGRVTMTALSHMPSHRHWAFWPRKQRRLFVPTVATVVDKFRYLTLRRVTVLPFLTTGRDTIAAVPTPDELAAQLVALRRVRSARLERERVTQSAQDKLRKAIIDALNTGASAADIAAASGFSRQWIDRLRREAGK